MADRDEVWVPEETITCIDCGGAAHLVTPLPGPDEGPLQPGDVLVYRCSDCLDRWDIEVPDFDDY